MSIKIAWSIAGVEPGGRAGLSTDLLTLHALGVHGCLIPATLTAPGAAREIDLECPSDVFFRAQWEAVASELPPAAVKIGALGNKHRVEQMTRLLPSVNVPTVLDPLRVSSPGARLLAPEAKDSMRELFKQVTMVTPNVPEAVAWAGFTSDPVTLAEYFLENGARECLLKGGHTTREDCADLWANGSQREWLLSPRHAHDARGTGCALSAAIAAGLAQGLPTLDALVLAKAYINRAIRLALPLPSGERVLFHEQWPRHATPGDFPVLSRDGVPPGPAFPSCGPEPLGFYPIVDRAAWLERLLPLGITTAQLRIKDLSGAELEREIDLGVKIARRYRCRLFLNDYWELALRHQAYGVHLGQEDLARLAPGCLSKLRSAGLRLGVSTHGYAEAARALFVHPSYLAIGPIFPTHAKPMKAAPQGVESLRQWRLLIDVPLVAIGGIRCEQARAICDAGADGIAVISDVTQAADPIDRTRQWMRAIRVV